MGKLKLTIAVAECNGALPRRTIQVPIDAYDIIKDKISSLYLFRAPFTNECNLIKLEDLTVKGSPDLTDTYMLSADLCSCLGLDVMQDTVVIASLPTIKELSKTPIRF